MTTIKVLRSTLIALAAAILGIIIAGCSGNAAPAPPPPPPVTVAPVEQRELVEWEEFTGRTGELQISSR